MNLKKVDCALLFMLDEEKNSFIEHNEQLIISEPNDGEFTEFFFFDKNGMYRTGVMFSGGEKMGNTEACYLFYRVSRKYVAELYINIGVAGVVNGIEVGDVLLATQLSTFGEQNATNAPWQSTGLNIEYNKFAESAFNNIKILEPDFSSFRFPI